MNMMHPEVVVTEARSLAALKEPDAATRAALDALPGLFSTDSHVMEPHAVWDDMPPAPRAIVHAWLSEIGFRADKLPAGAGDPHARLLDQQRDGVVAEILFPNDGMAIFGLPDPACAAGGVHRLQRLAGRLLQDRAESLLRRHRVVRVRHRRPRFDEMHRGLDMGLIGGMVWQVPDPQAAVHHRGTTIRCGRRPPKPARRCTCTSSPATPTRSRSASFVGAEKIRGAVNKKQNDTINALFDLIFSGVFDRHPKLQDRPRRERVRLAAVRPAAVGLLFRALPAQGVDGDRRASRARSSSSTSTARGSRTIRARASSRGGVRTT